MSKISLINKALTLVGANPITNINDSANNARIVNRVYEISLKSILSECKWNFATKRRLLSLSTDTLEWDYTNEAYVYARPADVIRIFGANDNNAIWREEGNYVISDTSGLGIIYVYYLDEPTRYTSSFTEALIDKLCSDIAFMIINSKSMAQGFLKKYNEVSLAKATAENSQIGVQQTLRDDAWSLAKSGNESINA